MAKIRIGVDNADAFFGILAYGIAVSDDWSVFDNIVSPADRLGSTMIAPKQIIE
jgi:hypothetical protein